MNKTINISLPQGLTDLAHQQVKAGYYSSISEVIRDALRQHLMPQPPTPQIKLSAQAESQFEQALKDHQDRKTILLDNIDDLDQFV